MRGQRGITLVALVVTIVVLLILAGITITYVLSDGGIFDTAQKAGKEQTKGLISDYASAAQATFLVESYQKVATDTDAQNAVEANFPDGYDVNTTSITVSADKHKISGSCTVTVNSVVYTVTFTDGVATVTYPEA